MSLFEKAGQTLHIIGCFYQPFLPSGSHSGPAWSPHTPLSGPQSTPPSLPHRGAASTGRQENKCLKHLSNLWPHQLISTLWSSNAIRDYCPPRRFYFHFPLFVSGIFERHFSMKSAAMFYTNGKEHISLVDSEFFNNAFLDILQYFLMNWRNSGIVPWLSTYLYFDAD